MIAEEQFFKMSKIIKELKQYGQVAPTSHPVQRERLAEYISEMLGEYGVSKLHFDIMDGEFVLDKTIDYTDIKKLKDEKVLYDYEFDLHLMISHLETNLDNYLNLNPETLMFHIKSLDDNSRLNEIVDKIRKVCKVGIVLDINDDVDIISFDILAKLDCVLVMSVKIGQSGQSFNKTAIEKIQYLKNNISKCLKLKPDDACVYMTIAVDGGLNQENTKICFEAGANSFAYGNYLYKAWLETK